MSYYILHPFCHRLLLYFFSFRAYVEFCGNHSRTHLKQRWPMWLIFLFFSFFVVSAVSPFSMWNACILGSFAWKFGCFFKFMRHSFTYLQVLCLSSWCFGDFWRWIACSELKIKVLVGSIWWSHCLELASVIRNRELHSGRIEVVTEASRNRMRKSDEIQKCGLWDEMFKFEVILVLHQVLHHSSVGMKLQ